MNTTPIKLDLVEMLPVIRKAFDEKSLQMFNQAQRDSMMCMYAGPCAIGVCMPEDRRAEFDVPFEEHATTGFGALVHFGRFIVSPDQADDIGQLQKLHDAAVTMSKFDDLEVLFGAFEDHLKHLEKKYKVKAHADSER